jgi:hypothetical protein
MLGLLLAGPGQGLSGEAGLRAWPVDPLVKVLRADEPPVSPAKGVLIEAARGEIENGQVAFRYSADVAKLTASAT